MIIVVVEYLADDGSTGTYFVDVSKLDLTDRVQRRYFDNIMSAHKHSSKVASTSLDASIKYGEDIFEAATVNPPCQVDDAVILYIE